MTALRLTDRVALVASGDMGFGLTHDFDSHVFLLGGGSEFALFDSGSGQDTAAVVEGIRQAGGEPAAVKFIFLTHAHADHAGGAAALRAITGARVCLGVDEADALRTADEVALGLRVAKRSGGYSRDFRLQACEVDVELTDGMGFMVGDSTVRAIATPGHSRGSFCYLVTAGAGLRTYLFAGDTVFEGGRLCLLNCPGSDLEGLRSSLPKLGRLGRIDALLPGHLSLRLSQGQKWIERAVKALKLMDLPPMIM